MRNRAVKDWCVCGLWLAATALLFLGALVPAQSADSEPGCAGVGIRIVPDNPAPGDTVRVRIGVVPGDHAPRTPGLRLPRRIVVDGGVLSALSCSSSSDHSGRVRGRELEGAVTCIEWQLPDYPSVSRIEVQVGGQAARAVVRTTGPEFSHTDSPSGAVAFH